MMKITWYHGGLEKEVTMYVFGNIELKDGKLLFAAGGHRYAIPAENVRKIELEEDE